MSFAIENGDITIFYPTKGITMRYYPELNCPDRTAMTEAMKLAEEMLKIAQKGFLNCDEDSCMLLYGIIRDCGYKIRRTAEQEQLGAQKKGDCCKTLH